MRQRPSFRPRSRIDIAIADGDSPEAAKLLQDADRLRSSPPREKRGFWGCHPDTLGRAQASVLAAEFVHARQVWGILSKRCLVQKQPPPLQGLGQNDLGYR